MNQGKDIGARDDLVERIAVLETELARHKQTEEIRRLNEGLERHVLERTAQLQAANEELRYEIAERKRAEETLRRRMELERVLSRLSSRFVGIADVDDAINDSLADIGTLTEADRSYLFLFRNGGAKMDNTHEWCKGGVSPQIDNLQNLPCATFRWWMAKLRAGELIHVTDVSAMPPEARAEQEILESQEIKSLLVLPVGMRGELAGFVGFDNVRETGEWRDQDLAILRVCSEILGSALERHRVEESLQGSERRFRTLASHAPVGIFQTDAEGDCLFVNERWVEMAGISAEDAAGHGWIRALHADDRAHVLAEWYSAAESGREFAMEYRYRMPGGKVTWVLGRGVGLRDNAGKVIGHLGTTVDITEHKELEQQLLRAQRLETAGRIAGQVAHDFNNLLGPLVGYPELIKMKLPPGHPAASFCDAMMEAAQRMADINTDMLTLSRRGLLHQQPADLNQLVQQTVAQMEDRPDTLEVELDLAPDLPSVSGSPAQLMRVLSNLAANAREAMADVGLLHIRTMNVYIDRPFGRYNRVEVGEYVRLDLTDTGCGIPPEIRDGIFDAFFTTKQSDRRRGSGLGLSVVGAIVGDHRGYIDLESRVGMGTTFSVYLPACRELTKETQVEGLRGGTEAILVVDDDQVQRDLAAQLLYTLGYQVDVAASGEEAEAYLKKHSVDLVILDMIMPPGIDGAETYRRMLELKPDQRAIIVSGFAETARVRDAQELGAGLYLRKPVNLEKLARAVREELDRKN